LRTTSSILADLTQIVNARGIWGIWENLGGGAFLKFKTAHYRILGKISSVLSTGHFCHN